MGVMDQVEFALTFALALVQLVSLMGNNLSTAINHEMLNDVIHQTTNDDMLCALSVLSLFGVFSRRRYCIVFTCLGMYYSAITALRWNIAVHHKFYTGQPVTCSQEVMTSSANGCHYYDMAYVVFCQLYLFLTLIASMLVSFRLRAPSDVPVAPPSPPTMSGPGPSH